MSTITHVNEQCHTYACAVLQVWIHQDTCAIYQDTCAITSTSCLRGLLVMSHISMTHVTHIHDSCHTYQWSCHTYQRVMSHILMTHVTHIINESCRACEWSVSHMWMSLVARMNAQCHTHRCVGCVTHIWMGCVRHICCILALSYALPSTSRLWGLDVFGIIPHLSTSLVAHINESCHTYGWVVS